MNRLVKFLVPRSYRTRIRKFLADEYCKETHINRALHGRLSPTYLEIGVRKGECFSQISATRRIAIDPAPQGVDALLGSEDRLFRMTSDDFFHEHAETVLGKQGVDVALVDGLHEFTQALRDVLSLETYMKPDGVIFIHDCNPPSRGHTECGGEWTGDVWKVAYYLTRQRSDLSFVTLDCDWGLGMVRRFNKRSLNSLPAPSLVEAIKVLDYDVLAKDRRGVLKLRPPWYSRFVL